MILVPMNYLHLASSYRACISEDSPYRGWVRKATGWRNSWWDCHDARRMLGRRRDCGIEECKPHNPLPEIGTYTLIISSVIDEFVPCNGGMVLSLKCLWWKYPQCFPAVTRSTWPRGNNASLFSLLNSNATLGAPIRNQTPQKQQIRGLFSNLAKQRCTRPGATRTAQRSDTRGFAFISPAFLLGWFCGLTTRARQELSSAQRRAAAPGRPPPKPPRHRGRSRRFRAQPCRAVPCRAVPCLGLDSQFRGGRGSRCAPGPARPFLRPRPRPREAEAALGAAHGLSAAAAALPVPRARRRRAVLQPRGERGRPPGQGCPHCRPGKGWARRGLAAGGGDSVPGRGAGRTGQLYTKEVLPGKG